ncbi:hypothetical protein HOY82DRAFT_555163 [Tuber indicum]|nr:hypothetical protein HOY82DRAFT_555163 [Tuber indicum]
MVISCMLYSLSQCCRGAALTFPEVDPVECPIFSTFAPGNKSPISLIVCHSYMFPPNLWAAHEKMHQSNLVCQEGLAEKPKCAVQVLDHRD